MSVIRINVYSGVIQYPVHIFEIIRCDDLQAVTRRLLTSRHADFGCLLQSACVLLSKVPTTDMKCAIPFPNRTF